MFVLVGLGSAVAAGVTYLAPKAWKATGDHLELFYYNQVYTHEVETTAKIGLELFGQAGEVLGRALGHVAAAPVALSPKNRFVGQVLNGAGEFAAGMIGNELKKPVISVLKPPKPPKAKEEVKVEKKVEKTQVKVEVEKDSVQIDEIKITDEPVLPNDGTDINPPAVEDDILEDTKSNEEQAPIDDEQAPIAEKLIEVEDIESLDTVQVSETKKETALITDNQIDAAQVAGGVALLGLAVLGGEMAASAIPYVNLIAAIPSLLSVAQSGIDVYKNGGKKEEVKLTDLELAEVKKFAERIEALNDQDRAEFFDAINSQARREVREAKLANVVTTAQMIGTIVAPSVIAGVGEIAGAHAKLYEINTAYTATVEVGRTTGYHLFGWVGSKVGAAFGHISGASVALSKENLKIADATAKLVQEGTEMALATGVKQSQQLKSDSTMLKTAACAGVLLVGAVATYAAPAVVLGALAGNMLKNSDVVYRYFSGFVSSEQIEDEIEFKEYSKLTQVLVKRFNNLSPKLLTAAKVKIADQYADAFMSEFEEIKISQKEEYEEVVVAEEYEEVVAADGKGIVIDQEQDEIASQKEKTSHTLAKRRESMGVVFHAEVAQNNE